MGSTLKKILKWLLIILILFVGLSYLFYKIDPRKYTYPFIILAHVVPDPPGHPDCVPGETDDREVPDFNDSWSAPQSEHELQHFEWLGKCVTQEGAPEANDRYDDGLGAVLFHHGQKWMKGSKFTMKVIVSTTWRDHPDQFPKDTGAIAVYSYIDWNLNHVFEKSELVHAWIGSPPFSTPVDKSNTVFETDTIIVPDFYEQEGTIPPIRLRMVWETSGTLLPAPGGVTKWGEVEDHFGPEEEIHL